MWRAARLDQVFYRDATTRESPWPTFSVVAVCVVAGAIGGATGALGGPGEVVAASALHGAADMVITWLLISQLVCLIGIVLLRARVSYRGALQALGFAYAPGVLFVFRAVPLIDIPLLAIAGFWQLAATYVAVRAAFALGHWKTMLILAVSLVTYGYIRVQLRFMTGV